MRYCIFFLVACIALTGHAGIRSVDKETALNAVKAERNLSDVDTANFYIGSVSSYIK